MALWIAAAEPATSVVLVLDVDHDFEPRGLGAGINCVSVRDNEVGSLRFLAVDLIRLADVPAVLVVCNRTEHHHAVAETELGVRYRAVSAFINRMPFETKHVAKPTNGGFGVTIAQPRKYCGARTFRAVRHGWNPYVVSCLFANCKRPQREFLRRAP